MNKLDIFTFDVRTRYYGGTYIATCHGSQASCTASQKDAAERAAKKHFEKVCQLCKWNVDEFGINSRNYAGDIYLVSFKLRAPAPDPEIMRARIFTPKGGPMVISPVKGARP